LPSRAGYRFLEHVTDALIEAWGETIEEAFSQAGTALFETMLDSRRVKPRIAEEITTYGHDEKELLYNYLEELLLVFEIKQLALGKFVVDSIKPYEGKLRLEGVTSGESYDRSKHNGRVEVKGITYHQMEIEHQAGRTTVRFLLDL